MRRLVAAFMAAAALTAAPALLAPAGLFQAEAASGRIAIQSGGATRTALLLQQRRLKQAPRPLVVILRASARDRAPRRGRLFGLDEMRRWAGATLVYPDPAGARWAFGKGAEAERDAGFVRDLVGRLVRAGGVDRRRIFIVGIGDGAAPAYRLACSANAPFAAYAASGAMPPDLAAACKPSKAPALMLIGAASAPREAPAKGAAEALAPEAALAVFARVSACGDGRAVTLPPDRDPRDGWKVVLDRLEGCKAPLAFARVENDPPPAHDAPPSGAQAADVVGSKLILDFFRGVAR
ncbi:phospholipase [Methylocella sp.]|uniref:phospholipase n=1 Tax=Methylocella sp. TaxID=1978226 RepID=UPI003782FA8A